MAIAGLVAALELARQQAKDLQTAWAGLRQALSEGLAGINAKIQILDAQNQSPHILACLIPDVTAKDCLIRLDQAGVSASSGSACSSGNDAPSPVLLDMGIGPEQAKGLIRFSFGPTSVMSDITAAVTALKQVLHG